MNRVMLALACLSLAACHRDDPAAGARSGEQLAPLPSTPEGSYALAQRFADCSARLELDAYVARLAKRPDLVTASEESALGWKIAGMAILALGMDSAGLSDAEAPFDKLVDTRLQQLKARYAREPARMKVENVPEFNRVCGPLVPTQAKLIELLREEASQK